MEQIILHQLLEKADLVFQEVGLHLVHEEQLAAALDLTLAAFRSTFGSKAELLLQVNRYSLARQRHEHTLLFANLRTPLECMLAWLHHSIQELRRTASFEFDMMRRHYPQVWQSIQDHLQDYAYPLLTRLLQEGIREGQFRAELQAPLTAHIILAQFGLVLNEQLFPPEQISTVEAYRNILFPYVRGLCTEEGRRIAETQFNKM